MIVSDGQRTKSIYSLHTDDDRDDGHDYDDVTVARPHLPHIKMTGIHSFDENVSGEINFIPCSTQRLIVSNPFPVISV